MKKNLLLSVCLLLAGGLYAQTPEAESPVFRLDGFDASTVSAFKTTPKEASDDLIPWTQPDTVVCNKATGSYGMYIYYYDERGNDTLSEALQYISTDIWMTTQKVISSYNQWDLVDTTTSHLYQQDGLAPNARKISSYDKRGRRVTLLNQTWNPQAEAWTSTSRYNYTYTKNNQIATILVEEPDTRVIGSEIWKQSQKTEYGYDEKGREISLEISVWTGSDWFPFRSIYSTYEDDLLTRELGYFFNEMTGAFGPTYRYENYYNEQKQKLHYLVFYTDTLGTWDTTLHTAYFYDDRGLNSGLLTRVYDQGAEKMLNRTREFYFYNEQGIKDSVVHEEFESSGEWWHTVSLRYFFNENGVMNSYIYYNLTEEYRATDKYEFEYNEYGDGTCSRSFTLQNGEWKPADRAALEVKDRNGNEIMRANYTLLSEITVSYLSGTKTPGPEPDTTADEPDTFNELRLQLDAQVDVYPNPATETLYVTIDGEGVYEVSLSTLTGTVVENFRMTAGRKTLNVSPYKGIYLLRVQKGGAAMTKKILFI